MEDFADQYEEQQVDSSLSKISHIVDFEALLKINDLQMVAEKIVESSYEEIDFMQMDTLDKFLDFVHFKINTGFVDIQSMAYPTKRITDEIIENKIIDLINIHLIPEIILKILKFFSRNINDPDTNLYIANLLYSDEIIKSIYDTFILFKKDIFKNDPVERGLNVKRIQQFSARSDLKVSSPLDASARLKYILDFLDFKLDIQHICKKEDISMSRVV